MPSPIPHRRSRGFTLVELLVVIGIIALLISILLPTLNRVRRTANLTACLSNIRQAGTAVAGYIVDNQGALPEAVYNNKTGLLSPSGTGRPAWSRLTHPTLGNTYVLPTIGELLEGYMGPPSPEGNSAWRCPNGDASNNAVDPYEVKGNDPYAGTLTGQDVWLPNYFYMNSKVYAGFSNPSLSATRVKPGFPATDWTVRNIAGLKAATARPVGGAGATTVVVFAEYKSTFHTQSRKDVYALMDGERTEFAGNFAYLDGHAASQKYKDRDGYMAQLHDPIVQKWYGRDFPGVYSEFYDEASFYPRNP